MTKEFRIDVEDLAKRARPKRKRPLRARNQPKTAEDLVFKASEIDVYAAGIEDPSTTVVLKKENGKVLRAGYIESVKMIEKDGVELAEFVCSPASHGEGMFRFYAEAAALPLQTQTRKIREQGENAAEKPV